MNDQGFFLNQEDEEPTVEVLQHFEGDSTQYKLLNVLEGALP